MQRGLDEASIDLLARQQPVATDLRLIRQYVAHQARTHKMRLGAAGTHPFSLFENQKITARDRYRALVETSPKGVLVHRDVAPAFVAGNVERDQRRQCAGQSQYEPGDRDRPEAAAHRRADHVLLGHPNIQGLFRKVSCITVQNAEAEVCCHQE